MGIGIVCMAMCAGRFIAFLFSINPWFGIFVAGVLFFIIGLGREHVDRQPTEIHFS